MGRLSWRLCHGASSRRGVCRVPAARLVTEMTACFVSLQSSHTDSLKACSQTNRCSCDARYLDLSLSLAHAHSTYKLSERRHITRDSMQARTLWCSTEHHKASLLWFNPTNDAVLSYDILYVCVYFTSQDLIIQSCWGENSEVYFPVVDIFQLPNSGADEWM